MSYDIKIDNAVRRLQAQLGLAPKHIDGAWGGTSQKALQASGKKLDYNWGYCVTTLADSPRHRLTASIR